MNNLLDLTPPVVHQTDPTPGDIISIILFFLLIIIAIIVVLALLVKCCKVISSKIRKKTAQKIQPDGLDESVEVKAVEKPREKEDIEDKMLRGFGSFLIKLILIACIILFGLVNYRRLSFSKGWTQTEIDDNMSMTEAVLTLTGISKVEYYDAAPAPFTSENYLVYIETSQKNYICAAAPDDIDALNALGIFSKSVRPQKITPVPFYVEIIVGIIVLAIPFGARKKCRE